MTTQSESTRNKISAMLEQVGMTDEELYQLLYGRKQQVEVDISMPQLLDEDLWLETEHTEEELNHISAQLSALEQIIVNPPEGAALKELEALLEGELFADEARGFLLRKFAKNWRNGISQFLAFLAFSELQKLAVAIANLTNPNLVSKFEQSQSRPQDRRVLADFIISQIEKPLPSIVGMLAEMGATMGATGTLEFKQPLTAAILQQSPEKLTQILKLLETKSQEATTELPGEFTKEMVEKRKSDATAMLNKLATLDRVENLVANQQGLQQQQQPRMNEATPINTATDQQQQQTQRRPRGSRRALREAMEREARERADQARVQVEIQATIQNENTRRTNAKETPAQRVIATQARQQQQQQSSSQRKKSSSDSKKTEAASAVITTLPPLLPVVTDPHHALHGVFAGLPLDAFKGMTATTVDPEQLGRTKSSLPKDRTPVSQNKPEQSFER